MSWVIDIFIAILIFGYTGYTFRKIISQKKAGKCGTCELQKHCSTCKCKEKQQ